MTTLITANSVDDIQECIDRGDDINQEFPQYRSAFIYHCEKGNTDIVKYLVEKGCDINLNDMVKGSGFQLVCQNGHVDLFDYLVDLVNIDGSNHEPILLGSTPLMGACDGHEEILRKLIEKGADIHLKNKLGCQAIHYANQSNILHLLYMAGADINAGNVFRTTPLHRAVMSNNYELCKDLLNLGANPDLLDSEKLTPLMIAKEGNLLDIIDLLENFGK